MGILKDKNFVIMDSLQVIGITTKSNISDEFWNEAKKVVGIQIVEDISEINGDVTDSFVKTLIDHNIVDEKSYCGCFDKHLFFNAMKLAWMFSRGGIIKIPSKRSVLKSIIDLADVKFFIKEDSPLVIIVRNRAFPSRKEDIAILITPRDYCTFSSTSRTIEFWFIRE